MDVTAITGIISSVVGFALMNHNPKKKTNSSSQTNASNTSDSNSEPTPDIPAQREDYDKDEETNEEKRSNSMYKGKDFDGGVYDSFYDYSAKNGNEKIYFQQSFLNNITSNDERVKACRVRMLGPFLTSELLGEDASFIGGKAVVRQAYNGGNKEVVMPIMYQNGNETMILTDGDKFVSKNVLKLAKGNVRNVCVWLQVFNPSPKDVKIEVLTVENIFIGETQCQPIHLRGDNYSYTIEYADGGSRSGRGRTEESSEIVGYSFANPKPTNMNDTIRMARVKLYQSGNETYFSGRELWTPNVPKSELDKSNGNLGWKEMAYPVDTVSNYPSRLTSFRDEIGVNDIQNQALVENGTYKVGLSTEVYNYDNGNFFKPKFLTVPANGYEIVKVMLPLACLKETKVTFGNATESRLNLPYNVLFGGRGLTKDSVSEADFEIAKNTFQKYIEDNKYDGSLLFDFVEAPSVANKTVKMTVEMFGDKSKCYPKGDPNLSVYGSSTSAGNRVDLKMIPQAIDEKDTDWRNSYCGKGPDETLTAQTQSGLLTGERAYLGLFSNAFSTVENN